MGSVYVYIWFDIEDYVTKESDDLPLIAFDILAKYHVPVTCKIVAEKIRRLEENRRSDVISAISSYDVGYHLDTHSQHPTLYEYLKDLDVLSGSDEFLIRERKGLEKLEQTFSRVPSCFGHGGPTWAPHPYPALQKMNIHVYLDETPILNLNNQPYWYCGILSLNGANQNYICFDYTFEKKNELKILKQKFKKIHDRLKRDGGGAVSILFHLHTAINRKFWDEVNFAEGKNTPKEEYKRPPAQTIEMTRRAWADFDELIRYVSSFDDVKFITATDAARIYHREKQSLTPQELRKVVQHFSASSNYLQIDNGFLSPSEGFYAVISSLSDPVPSSLIKQVTFREPLGPMAPFRSVGRRRLVTEDFIKAVRRTRKLLDRETCLPTSIDIGDYARLNPHDFLATASRLLQLVMSGKRLPKLINRSTGKPPNLQYINSAEFKKACKWKVLPHNFRSPKILEQIQLQAWTLRPAIALKESTV
jgi:hypothetical protein